MPWQWVPSSHSAPPPIPPNAPTFVHHHFHYPPNPLPHPFTPFGSTQAWESPNYSSAPFEGTWPPFDPIHNSFPNQSRSSGASFHEPKRTSDKRTLAEFLTDVRVRDDMSTKEFLTFRELHRREWMTKHRDSNLNAKQREDFCRQAFERLRLKLSSTRGVGDAHEHLKKKAKTGQRICLHCHACTHILIEIRV